jgi:uncharacterized repeat protein (TIGR01451 family)
MDMSESQIFDVEHGRRARSGSVVTEFIIMILIVVAVVGAVVGKWVVTAICGLVLALAIVSRLWARLALVEVHYSCVPSNNRLMIGDTIDLVGTIENRKPLPLSWVRISESIPSGLTFVQDRPPILNFFGVEEVRETTSLGPYERVRFHHTLRAMRRGHYAIGPSRIVSGDIFGFYEVRRDIPMRPQSVVVYPKIVPLPNFDLRSFRPIGDSWSRSQLVDDLTRPSGLREYRSGDSARRIDWKATARRGDVFVRTYDPSVSQRVTIFLDCNTSVSGRWANRPAVLEAAVCGAASVAARCTDLGYAVGLVLNGNTAGKLARPVIAPGAGPDQLTALMTTLAGANSQTARPIEDLVARYGPEALPPGATIVYIAGVYRPKTAAFLADLQRRGHQITALYVGEGAPPEFPGLRIDDYRAVFTMSEVADA